ncbi:hypothetical protein NF27_DT01100 [Candidatus Jidaibacter acanthamoeba]|uniref:FCP1 homology domain-containing protein n=1 Tax=Candidatus Jidaibacter acanthamoebae TaxID=86105 RepID=A0A0C1MZ77_9RICK|nr:hypothetical protein [Candidatus Jidaibacter acanthamoeba]KIE05336.1 hypothetical protein NF27_DT01100 [Candidatus Jidaibacter acanthamoeba]
MREARVLYEQPAKRKSTLVCFDFDQTILNEHSHNQIKCKQLSNFSEHIEADYLGELINQEPDGVFKNREKLLETFNLFFEQGHNIAITSFTEYKSLIIPVLKFLGLSKEQLSKIHVEAWLPKTQDYMSKFGKNGHIRKAMDHFKVNEYQLVMLIDDSINNIEIAKHNNIKTVLVSTKHNPDPAYLDESVKLGEELIKQATAKDNEPEVLTSKEKNTSWVARENVRNYNQLGSNQLGLNL